MTNESKTMTNEQTLTLVNDLRKLNVSWEVISETILKMLNTK